MKIKIIVEKLDEIVTELASEVMSPHGNEEELRGAIKNVLPKLQCIIRFLKKEVG